MKKLTETINESKIKNLFIPEYDVRTYLDFMLNKWLEATKSWNVLTGIDAYTKIALLRQCEVLMYILEKFSDDLLLHFTSEEPKKDDKGTYVYEYCYSFEDRVAKAFHVIMKVMEIETPKPANFEKGDDMDGEIAELKSRFKDLTDKCNKKWHDKFDKNNASTIGVAVPCGDACCDCCCKCESC